MTYINIREWQVGEVAEIVPCDHEWFYNRNLDRFSRPPGENTWVEVIGKNIPLPHSIYTLSIKVILKPFGGGEAFGTDYPYYCLKPVPIELVQEARRRMALAEEIRKANRPVTKLVRVTKKYLGIGDW